MIIDCLRDLRLGLKALRFGFSESREMVMSVLALLGLGDIVAAIVFRKWAVLIPGGMISAAWLFLSWYFIREQRERFAFSARRLASLSERELWAFGLMFESLGAKRSRGNWFCDLDLAARLGDDPLMASLDFENQFAAQRLIRAVWRAGLLERKRQGEYEFGRRLYQPSSPRERYEDELERRDLKAVHCERPGRASRPSALAERAIVSL